VDRIEEQTETARSVPSRNATWRVAQPSKVLSQPERELVCTEALRRIFTAGE